MPVLRSLTQAQYDNLRHPSARGSARAGASGGVSGADVSAQLAGKISITEAP